MNPTNTPINTPSNDSDKYVRFATNVPQIVALRFATGRPAPAQKEGYPDQVMFTTVDDRRMYIAPFAADLIAQQGIEAGEEFSIGKFEIKSGQRKRIEWIVQRIEPVPVPAPETPLEADLRRSVEAARAARPQSVPLRRSPPVQSIPQPQAIPTPRPAPSPARSPAPAAMPSAGGTMPIAPTTRNPSSPPAPAPPTKVPYEAAFAEFLVIAGRATRHAEQVLGSEGGSVRFNNRNIAALATSMFINAGHNGWITWGGIK